MTLAGIAVTGTSRKLTQALLSGFSGISENEIAHLLLLVQHPEKRSPGCQLIAQDAPLSRPLFLLSGWACLEALLPDGRRQIVDLYVPGDVMGLSTRPHAKAKGAYTALTTVEIAREEELGCERPGLLQSYHLLEEAHERRLIQSVVRIGRLAAMERLAALLLDLHDRLSAKGQVSNGRFDLPLKQETLADALGLSVVHINRSLQQLRRDGLIRWIGHDMQILDFNRMVDYACIATQVRKPQQSLSSNRADTCS